MELSGLVAAGCLTSLILSIVAIWRSFRRPIPTPESPFVDEALERLKGHEIRSLLLTAGDPIADHTLSDYDRDALYMHRGGRTVAVMRHSVVMFDEMLAVESVHQDSGIQAQSLVDFLRGLAEDIVRYRTVNGEEQDHLRLDRVEGRAIWLYHDDDWSKREHPRIIPFRGLCTIEKGGQLGYP